MELMAAIHERKSYRKPYKPDPLPAEAIKEILEAGVSAPSGCNQQTTRFIGVNDPELAHKLAEIYDKPWALTAPAAILLLTKEHVSYRGNSYHIHDYSAAAENILLAAVDGFVRFNLGSLPVLLAGILFGPWAGFVVGMVADIIGGVLAGYAINPLITLGAASIGLVGGLGWQKLSHLRTGNRLWCSVLAAHFVGSMVINSLALHIFYGYAWAVLIARIPNALVLTAVNTVLLRILLENRALMAMAKR